MNNFSSRLKEALEYRNLKPIDLSKKTNLGKSSISDWLSGRYEAKQDKVFIIAKALNVSEAWLMGLDVPMEKEKGNDILSIYNKLEQKNKHKVYSFAKRQLEKQNEAIKYPNIINVIGQTAAGSPVSYGDDCNEEREFKTIPKGAQYALNVKGDSMEPLIMDGSIVFYKEQPNVESGEIAIIEVDGDAVTCKKVVFNYEDNKVVLKSINKNYEDVILSGDQVRIIGKVVI